MPPERRSQVSVRTAATVTLTVLAIGAAGWVVVHARVTIALAAGALVVAVALDRPAAWLAGRGLPRGLAVGAIFGALVAAVAGVLLLLLPPAITQLADLAGRVPTLLARARGSELYAAANRALDLDAALHRLQAEAPALVQGAVSPVLGVAAGALGFVAGVVTFLFVVAFMLAAGRPLLAAALAQARPGRRPTWEDLVEKVRGAIAGYVGGLLAVVAAHATLTATFLAIVDVPSFLALGVLSALGSLVPFAGAVVTGAIIALVAWGASGPWTALAVVGWYVGYAQFENNVLSPVVYRRAIALNPLVAILAVLACAEVAGLAGAVLAVPATAVAQIVLREVLRARRERLGLAADAPAPPAS
jgi:predicted PurR-regulated permease PerM